MKTLTIDRSGSLDLQANVMLKLLECILESEAVEVRVFDTRRQGKVDPYTCSVSYSHAANVVNDVTPTKIH